MTTPSSYIFCSERLGFRNWQDADIEPMTAINTDPEVMAYFSRTQDASLTVAAIGRMRDEYDQKGHCYFAVDLLSSGELIGFIGLHEQTFEADFTPCIDIGWRLKKAVWNQGLATEGARACLQYGFRQLQLKRIYSITPKINLRSERIMQKIGMQKEKNFICALLLGDARLEECVLYSIRAESLENK
jgi:RimJ/RimL family protein N-acetyltransferase